MLKNLKMAGIQEKPKGRQCGSKLGPLGTKIIKLRKRYECGSPQDGRLLGHKGYTVGHHQVYSLICEAGLNPSN